MKKLLTVFFLALTGLLVVQPMLFAQTDKTFVVSANVPTASSVAINASSVSTSGNVFTPVSGTSLSFNPLTFNATTNAYYPDHYFAIDVIAQSGAGSPSATVTYSEGANPNSATTGHGMGWKSTATFVKTSGSGSSTTDAPMAAHGPKKLLKDVSGESITAAQTTGGWLRIYLGIVTKDPNAAIQDPATGELFTNGDRPGTYDGTVVISATVS